MVWGIGGGPELDVSRELEQQARRERRGGGAEARHEVEPAPRRGRDTRAWQIGRGWSAGLGLELPHWDTTARARGKRRCPPRPWRSRCGATLRRQTGAGRRKVVVRGAGTSPARLAAPLWRARGHLLGLQFEPAPSQWCGMKRRSPGCSVASRPTASPKRDSGAAARRGGGASRCTRARWSSGWCAGKGASAPAWRGSKSTARLVPGGSRWPTVKVREESR